MMISRAVALAVCLSLLVSCGRDAGHARSDLLKLNYQFTAEDFVRAAQAGDEKAVALFLDAGIDVNASAADGSTALIGASENNATRIIELLTKKGASHEQKDREGWTPLMKAVYADKVEAVRLLAAESKGDLNRALLLASLMGHTAVAQALLQNGAEVDTTGPEGQTPLGYTRKSGNVALEKLLLEAGADPGATADLPSEIRPEASPGPTILPSERAALLRDPAAMKKSSEEAWWSKYGLDLDEENIFLKDSDDDGFPNSEEFLADTSPIDPASHPPAAGKLTWVAYHREALPYALQKVENDIATLQDAVGQPVEAKTGDKIGDWTIVAVRPRLSYDKDGRTFDGSDLLVQDATGRKFRLVPGINAPAGDSYASVRLPFSNEEQHLRVNEEFALPNDGKRRYRVLDLREEQVVLQEITTGRTFTISKTP